MEPGLAMQLIFAAEVLLSCLHRASRPRPGLQNLSTQAHRYLHFPVRSSTIFKNFLDRKCLGTMGSGWPPPASQSVLRGGWVASMSCLSVCLSVSPGALNSCPVPACLLHGVTGMRLRPQRLQPLSRDLLLSSKLSPRLLTARFECVFNP